MIIDERIFREIESVDISDYSFYEENFNLLYDLASKEAQVDGFDDEEEEEREEAIENALSSIVSVYRVHLDSLLYKALLEWYKDFANLEENVRSCTLDGDYIYFVAGCGYDIISSDLLGGTADGQAKKEFLNFLNGKN